MSQFYESWIQSKEFQHVESLISFEVFQSSLHGDGIKINENVSKNSIIFNEKPLHHLQSLPNKQHVLTCSSCLRFLGSIDFQIKYLTKQISRPQIDSFLKSLSFDQIEFLLPCSYGCGEYYCCQPCRDNHWNSCHKLLCTGLISEEEAESSALIQYKQLAVESNEIFLLCGDVFAKICLSVEKDINSHGTNLSDAIFHALRPYQHYVRQLWWEAAKPPSGTNPKKLIRSLKGLVKDAWILLSESLHLQERGLVSALSEESLSRTIGMFEQNNVGIRMQSPLAKLVESLQDDEKEKIENFREVVNIIIDQINSEDYECNEPDYEEDDDENDEPEDEEDILGSSNIKTSASASASVNANSNIDNITKNRDNLNSLESLWELIEEEGGIDRIFPPLDGTAFYKWICKINHSCEPNIMVKYAISDQYGLHAQVIALRDISAGEELVQSYIDQFMPFSSRQKALEDYGFVCSCNKCQSE